MSRRQNHRPPQQSQNHRPNKERSTPATARRDQVLADWATLRIPLTAEQLDSVLSEAEQAGWSHLDFLHRLLADQAGQRRARSIARRIKEANFRDLKPLSAFDWNFNPLIPRTQIETLAQCDFLRRKQHVVLVGQSGVGKSHLIQSIGEAACILGFRVYYITSGALVEDLTAALADHTIHKRVGFYARFDLLIIDEFGFDKIERSLYPHALSLWYKIIDARSQRASTALLTNVDFDDWTKYLGDEHLAMALLDRVVDGATILKLTGKSYRIHRGDQPTK
ncbi:MAG: IS21-like element helper ATPase IstB [Candidatus Binataceae bacterium]